MGEEKNKVMWSVEEGSKSGDYGNRDNNIEPLQFKTELENITSIRRNRNGVMLLVCFLLCRSIANKNYWRCTWKEEKCGRNFWILNNCLPRFDGITNTWPNKNSVQRRIREKKILETINRTTNWLTKTKVSGHEGSERPHPKPATGHNPQTVPFTS